MQKNKPNEKDRAIGLFLLPKIGNEGHRWLDGSRESSPKFGVNCLRYNKYRLLSLCPPRERERSQGGILAGGDFRPPFGRKYNRLPLDGVTRITLLLGKKPQLLSLPPRRGENGVKGTSPLAGS